MATEVTTSQQLLEVVRQSNRVKLDNAARELLHSAWMNITMNVVLTMKELKGEDDLPDHEECLLLRKVLLAEGLPC